MLGDHKELIFSLEYRNRAKKRPQDFTRERKMSFTQMIVFMLNMLKQSTQTALDHFFDLTEECAIHMSQQSFSEARQKLRWEACRELMDVSVKSIYSRVYRTWHGYRVWAIDGTKIQLPSSPELLEMFGGMGRGSSAVTAQSSCMYDILNDVIGDAQLEPMHVDERTLAQRHLLQLCTLESFSKELVILDRGYPSFKLIELFEATGVVYLMRVRSKFNLDIDNMPLGDHQYRLAHQGKQILVRVIKFLLPNGEIETLITNLFDQRMGKNAFTTLYFKRWPVETKYNQLKLQLEIENFSGRTREAIYQDYYMIAYLSNMIAVAAKEAQPMIDETHAEKGNKFDYKVNKNHAVGVLKDRFIMALLESNPHKQEKAVNKIFSLLVYHATPIRPKRSVDRNPNPRRARFHFNQKSNC